MTAIDVTPAGNQLFQVDIRDEEGESRHQISVPDGLMDQLDTDGLAMQDLILASVDFLTTRESRQDLDPSISLGDVAERYDDFTEAVPAMARERATTEGQPTGYRAEGQTDEPTLSGDDRLLAEVRDEQAEGQAARQDERF
jgi:hypothetical protein